MFFIISPFSIALTSFGRKKCRMPRAPTAALLPKQLSYFCCFNCVDRVSLTVEHCRWTTMPWFSCSRTTSLSQMRFKNRTELYLHALWRGNSTEVSKKAETVRSMKAKAGQERKTIFTISNGDGIFRTDSPAKFTVVLGYIHFLTFTPRFSWKPSYFFETRVFKSAIFASTTSCRHRAAQSCHKNSNFHFSGPDLTGCKEPAFVVTQILGQQKEDVVRKERVCNEFLLSLWCFLPVFPLIEHYGTRTLLVVTNFSDYGSRTVVSNFGNIILTSVRKSLHKNIHMEKYSIRSERQKVVER